MMTRKLTGALLLGGLLSAGTAHAGVGWEHTISVRVGGQKPVTTVKMYNHWEGERHRILLKYSLSDPNMQGMPKRSPVFSTFAPLAATSLTPTPIQAISGGTGGLALITRLDDDRILAYATQERKFAEEGRRALLKKSRFDPFKKRAPRLSEELPPSFTHEQRKRLGSEIRAIVQPFEAKAFKIYFRALPGRRTFDGIEGRGYRLTTLINAGDSNPKSAQWARVNYEWWLASDLPGDELIRSFFKNSRESVRDIAYPSTSLWINEFFPVLWQVLPEEVHQATQTLAPLPGSPREYFGGTPLRLYQTISAPPMARVMSQATDVRVEVALTRHDVRPFAASLFEVPGDFERVPLDPFFEQLDKLSQTDFARALPEAYPTETTGLTWRAWNDYTDATTRALRLR